MLQLDPGIQSYGICILVQKVTDIQPRDERGLRPLHSAAKNGHSKASILIMSKIEVKNPEANESAAHLGHINNCRYILV